MLTSMVEREKLIFPKNWDISEILKLAKTEQVIIPAENAQYQNRLYGDIWLSWIFMLINSA
ncbi:MAG: hypothetical protein LBU04_06910 [Christensenellaceae bacterium]|nr:hypothetical protein [Christensenellaceae bacterium]